MLTSTSTNPAIQAYKVYHLSQAKLDVECRRQIPDLHRIVAHASIVDSVRRWSRDLAEPTEIVPVDPDSDADSDPLEDCHPEDESGKPVRQVVLFDADVDDAAQFHEIRAGSKVMEIHTTLVQSNEKSNLIPSPQRRPPPPPPKASTYDLKDQSWRQTRPVVVRETAVEVTEEDS
ncbi:uncharacterized protein Z518_03223 [Rhinocladiella mackenziei CBS 650.93]|uniref:Uncharacterized protein n=1 Tax=Rhinocladiella mackenziei CBS 650.93 TaxID=1442369 RepID=A0A0D2G253_9EURO|nr:uncharacterized protein Z518_03223 [Rhinocladiella mackenziei CBS 650.93]KIX08567.1 hypothetical protein Z518_03223 [Rhinocladiella mackenziei CBS 650.93]